MDCPNTSVDVHWKQTQITKTVDILAQLNVDNPVDWAGDLNGLCKKCVDLTTEKLGIAPESVVDLIPALKPYNPDDISDLWKYICLIIHQLELLAGVLKVGDASGCLSVQQTKHVKNAIRNLVGVGISSNILPNLPYYTKLPSDGTLNVPVFTRYKLLVATTFGVCQCAINAELRSFIIPEYLKWILPALYQICYCPLKKPTDEPDQNGFVMTQEIYDTSMNNRRDFAAFLSKFSSSVHPVLYVRETMMLLTKESPMWLKRALTATLSKTISAPKGVENVAWAMLDAAGLDNPDDSTKSWKALDIIAKILIDSRKAIDFRGNICGQLGGLLKLRDRTGEPIRPFERLFTLCTKMLFHQDEPLCQEVFISRLLAPLICFTNDERNLVNGEDVTESVSQTARMLRSLVAERNFNIPVLPVHTLIPVVNVLFRIYAVTCCTNAFKGLIEDVKEVLVCLLTELEADGKFGLLDNLLFGYPWSSCLELRNDIELVAENNRLTVKLWDYTAGLRPLKRSEVLVHLLKDSPKAVTTTFSYLLNCVTNGDKYFSTQSRSRELLHLEGEVVLDEVAEKHIAVYKLLSELAEDKSVQKHMREDPGGVIDYINVVFLKSIDTDTHKMAEFESEGFQALFTVVMLLQALTENAPGETLDHYKILDGPLEIISKECGNAELKELTREILSKLRGELRGNDGIMEGSGKTKLDKALEDICDPLLPVRGHGLMTLAKLVETKDEGAIERKQYILNIFQQSMKNEDSFIYLSAIGGLASMGDVFPDTVLKVLAEEYSDFSRKDSTDGHEVRMKLGEVLVRVTKNLGEMAPKYKTLLLNTFLVGTKDEDHLIRASSLSNLGEICRVLGYKLGTIVTEVLVCVHAIITTDKAVEARRAAVTVIRQLFVGLEKEMIVFLKDEILPIYRTLKHIYYHDSDDVMKLQAQLALEQLNENMKDFVFPNPQLHTEKKIVMLN